jgi:threonine/homoserine/homoserine lactone efflux protein
VTITHAFLSFAAVAGLLTIIPGLDTAVVLRTALAHGRGAAFATAVGIGTGALIWGIAAATGVSVLLTASHTAYLALRVVGAGYLVWMGGRMLVDALRGRGYEPAPAPDPGDPGAVDRGPRLVRAWSRGLGTNLLNPKIGVFYVAMLPQFIPAGAPHLLMGAALALVHDVEGMIWFTALILTAHTARRLFDDGRVKRAMDAVTGSVLVGFGLRLAASRN